MKYSKVTAAAALLALASAALVPVPAQATSADAWMKLNYALAMMDRVNALQHDFGSDATGAPAAVAVPQPIAGNSGPFLSPYAQDGTLTPWVSRAMRAQAGAAVGNELGSRAVDAVAARVPMVGGLFSGFMKNKTRESAAAISMGGWDHIRTTSDQSFANLDDLAVNLHIAHSGRSDYQGALAATMALYPALESRYEAANRNALQQAAQSRLTTVR